MVLKFKTKFEVKNVHESKSKKKDFFKSLNLGRTGVIVRNKMLIFEVKIVRN